MSNTENSVVEWDGQTHHHMERSTDWFWTLGLISVVTAGLSIWFNDVLFSIIIIIAAITIGVIASRIPRDLHVHIDENGIHIDRDQYQYKIIRSFWIRTEFIPSPRLHIATNNIIHPNIALTIPTDELAEQVRSKLLQHSVKEEEHHTGGTMIADLLGL